MSFSAPSFTYFKHTLLASSYRQSLKSCVCDSGKKNYNTVQSSAVVWEQLQIAEFEKIWQMMFVTLAWQRSLIWVTQPRRSAIQHRWHGRHPTIRSISLYGSEVDTTQNASRTSFIHTERYDAQKSRLLKAYTKYMRSTSNYQARWIATNIRVCE